MSDTKKPTLRPTLTGKALTQRLEDLGYNRLYGESDLELRKRAFPEMFELDPTAAIEILFGRPAEDLDIGILAAAVQVKKRKLNRVQLHQLAGDFLKMIQPN